VLYSGGDGLARELAEQRRGVIPRRVGVVAQTCGCQSIKWLGCASRCGGDVCAGTLERGGLRPRGALSPRVRWTSPEGVLSPQARRASPDGALSLVALVGHGGPQGRDRAVCVFWVRGLVCVLSFYEARWVFPGCLGDS
jgi:hypothetical protein